MNDPLDLVGIGIGPFNLSLAALLEKTPTVKNLFFERKPAFDWHSEIMFADSTMQTTYLKDLVTPVDPTSPYSFLNYLVDRNLFYQFLNTQRTVISRREFEIYCTWVSEKLRHKLKFETDIKEVTFDNTHFNIRTTDKVYQSKNICVATGMVPRIPECAKKFIGPDCFHAKSSHLKSLNAEGKSIVIIGGGQTGIEIYRNALQNKWGHAKSVRLITRRKNLEPLDESAFTNEYFSPSYVNSFLQLGSDKKSSIVSSQKLASDGNTPTYLLDLYNDLYRLKHIENDQREIQMLACRNLLKIEKIQDRFCLSLQNTFLECNEEMSADIVILSTGFESQIPPLLQPLKERLAFDQVGNFQLENSYTVKWNGPTENRIYALNFSRHHHGIVDPQTSLMAWRSAVVVNDLTQQEIYRTEPSTNNFVQYDSVRFQVK